MAVMAEPVTMAIWPGQAPGSEVWTHEEQASFSPPPGRSPWVRNVVRERATDWGSSRSASAWSASRPAGSSPAA